MMRKIFVVMLAAVLVATATPLQAEEDEENSSWEESRAYIGSGFRFCGVVVQGSVVSLKDLTGYCFAGAGFTVPESGSYDISIEDNYAGDVLGHYHHCVADWECEGYSFCNTTRTGYHEAGDSFTVRIEDPITGTLGCGDLSTPVEGTITVEEAFELHPAVK